MSWKILFWIATALLIASVPLIFGSAMAVDAGAVSCTFDTGLWAACVKIAYVMLALRIGVPLVLLLGVVKLITDKKKK